MFDNKWTFHVSMYLIIIIIISLLINLTNFNAMAIHSHLIESNRKQIKLKQKKNQKKIIIKQKMAN